MDRHVSAETCRDIARSPSSFATRAPLRSAVRPWPPPPPPGLPEKRALFPDQAEAVSRLARHLRRPGTRGLYVAATGTGKTLVSVRVTDELRARLVLFVVPTLDLAARPALAWRRDGHTEHMVIVSSMDAAGRDALVSARVTSSSDPVTLAALMSVVGEREDQIQALTLICTYDSLDKIQETRNTAYAVPPFDLAVMDEAHRVAGRPDKKWAAVHDNQRIRADRRLHTTATPRIFSAPDLAESADTTRPRRRTPTPTAPARRPTCSPTPWTTNRSTAKRSSSIRWPRRSRTAGHRTAASWCPPSPTRTCAAASTSQHPTPTPTVRARDRTRPCAWPPCVPPPCTWPCCAPSPATA